MTALRPPVPWTPGGPGPCAPAAVPFTPAGMPPCTPAAAPCTPAAQWPRGPAPRSPAAVPFTPAGPPPCTPAAAPCTPAAQWPCTPAPGFVPRTPPRGLAAPFTPRGPAPRPASATHLLQENIRIPEVERSFREELHEIADVGYPAVAPRTPAAPFTPRGPAPRPEESLQENIKMQFGEVEHSLKQERAKLDFFCCLFCFREKSSSDSSS